MASKIQNAYVIIISYFIMMSINLLLISSGPLDPAHTRFVGQTSVVVATVGTSQPLQLEPRDEYSNLCTYAPEADHKNNYKVTLVEVSNFMRGLYSILSTELGHSGR